LFARDALGGECCSALGGHTYRFLDQLVLRCASGLGSGRFLEDELAFQRGAFPRHLGFPCFLGHGDAHALEELFHCQPFGVEIGDQVLGEDAILTSAVAGDRAWRGGVGEQGADGRIHLCQTRVGGPEAAGERIVSAGVENDDVRRALCLLHLAQQQADVDGGVGHLVFGLDIGIYRDEEVATLHLHAVPGVIEDGNRAGCQSGPKLADDVRHGFLGLVLSVGDVETEILQRPRNGACVVYRISQRRGWIGAVADDQGHPLEAFGSVPLGECRR